MEKSFRLAYQPVIKSLRIVIRVFLGNDGVDRYQLKRRMLVLSISSAYLTFFFILLFNLFF